MAEYTIYEHARGEWEVQDPKGCFIISEWVTKREAKYICNRENKKLELKGRMFCLELQLLVANILPELRVNESGVNDVINDLFEYNSVENLITMEKDKEFLKECLIAIILQQ